VIDDGSRRISERLGLRDARALLGVDAEGYLIWAVANFPAPGPGASEAIETQIRGQMRLPNHDEAVPGDRPLAPQFTATVLDQKERFDLASTRGRPVLLLFFLHTCPHCHEALEYLKKALADMPEDKRPLLVGLELTGRSDAVRAKLKEDGLDFFPVLFDDSGKVEAAYGSFAGVPDLIMIDRDGRIAHRVQGWRGETDGRSCECGWRSSPARRSRCCCAPRDTREARRAACATNRSTRRGNSPTTRTRSIRS
jgi:peroxiredoxin